MAKFKIGSEVVVSMTSGDTVAEIQSHAKGWYTVQTSDGVIRKIRESKIKSAAESARVPAASTKEETPEVAKNTPATGRKPRTANQVKAAKSAEAVKAKAAKAEAAKANSDGDEPEDDSRDIFRDSIRKGYSRFKPEGKKSRLDNGDNTAIALRSLDREGFIKVAAAVLEDFTVGTINEKYGHLNNGQVRMTLGVRIRNAEVSITAIKKARKTLRV